MATCNKIGTGCKPRISAYYCDQNYEEFADGKPRWVICACDDDLAEIPVKFCPWCAKPIEEDPNAG